jgi:hypothetical protein
MVRVWSSHEEDVDDEDSVEKWSEATLRMRKDLRRDMMF